MNTYQAAERLNSARHDLRLDTIQTVLYAGATAFAGATNYMESGSRPLGIIGFGLFGSLFTINGIKTASNVGRVRELLDIIDYESEHEELHTVEVYDYEQEVEYDNIFTHDWAE